MPKSLLPLYMDSNAWIDVVQRTSQGRLLEPILEAAEQDKATIVASTLIRAEVQGNKKSSSEQLEQIDSFMAQSYINYYAVTTDIADLARALARDRGIRTIDAIHIATCLSYGILWFITRDGAETKGKRTKLFKLNGYATSSGTLRVVTPEEYLTIHDLKNLYT